MVPKLLENINSDLKEALKARDDSKVLTLRFLLAAIKNLEIDKYPPSKGGSLTDEDVLSVIQKQVKTHKESIEMFEKGGRADLVEKEKKELSVLTDFLPEELDEEIVKREVAEGLAALKQQGGDLSNTGKVIGILMPKFKGRVDGGTVARIVKEMLAKMA
jgi:hypothetical protein